MTPATKKLAEERHRLYRLMQKAYRAIDELKHQRLVGLVKPREFHRKLKVLMTVYDQAIQRYEENSLVLLGKKRGKR